MKLLNAVRKNGAYRTMIFVILVGVCSKAAFGNTDWPNASSLYLSRSSLWEKTVITSNEGGNQNVISTYSSGSKSGNRALSHGTSRHYNNGIVTYSSIWIQNYKSYSATPAFKAPYLPGWNISSHVRYSASFALDYLIPSTWDGHLDIDLNVDCQPVDSRGNDSGSIRFKRYNHIRGAGQRGRLFISPYSQSKSVDWDSTVYFYLHD